MVFKVETVDKGEIGPKEEMVYLVDPGENVDLLGCKGLLDLLVEELPTSGGEIVPVQKYQVLRWSTLVLLEAPNIIKMEVVLIIFVCQKFPSTALILHTELECRTIPLSMEQSMKILYKEVKTKMLLVHSAMYQLDQLIS